MTRGATIQEDSVEYKVDGASVGAISRAETYNMQYWRSYVPDGWRDATFGQTTGAATSASRWNFAEFAANGGTGPRPGDANGDGKVTDADAAILATNWQSTEATWMMGDFNADGNVTDADAAILATHWQEGVTEATAVPEPSTLVLLAMGLVWLAGCRWRARR